MRDNEPRVGSKATVTTSSMGWCATIALGLLLAACLASIVFISCTHAVTSAKDPLPFLIAVVGVIGVLWTGLVTAAGLLLKEAVDNRTLALQLDAEVRLKMDSALKAVELMTTPGVSGEVARERREGSIIALLSIRQSDIALPLLEQYIASDLVSPRFTARILDRFLLSNDPVLQLDAAAILNRHSDKFAAEPDWYAFPACVWLKWKPELPKQAKIWLVEGLIEIMMSKPRSFWHESVSNQFAFSLYTIFNSDPDIRVKATAAAYALEICKLPGLENGEFFSPDLIKVGYAHIRTMAELALKADAIREHGSQRALDNLDKIARWGASAEPALDMDVDPAR